jgi:hypothetical protein
MVPIKSYWIAALIVLQLAVLGMLLSNRAHCDEKTAAPATSVSVPMRAYTYKTLRGQLTDSGPDAGSDAGGGDSGMPVCKHVGMLRGCL